MYVGADGCTDGWIAITYSDDDYHGASFYESIEELWNEHRDADRILLDIPIGLRETGGEPRPCDVAAREKLKPDRYRSVFTPPIRGATKEDSYEDAKDIQESNTDRSLSRQSWGISSKIAAVDDLLLDDDDEARERIWESHPEVCFTAFEGSPMRHSKTSGGARAFWERIEVLREIDPDIIQHVETARLSEHADRVDNDDLLDAFALALTARGSEEGLEALPEESEEPPVDDEELPMEIVYRPDPDPLAATDD